MIVRGKYEALTIAIVGVLARPKSPVSIFISLKTSKLMIPSVVSLLGMIHQLITDRLLTSYNRLYLIVHIQWTRSRCLLLHLEMLHHQHLLFNNILILHRILTIYRHHQLRILMVLGWLHPNNKFAHNHK